MILCPYRIQQFISTDSLLNAFTRFTRRRGVYVPRDTISKNCTNFVGGVNELKELVSQLDKDEIQETTVQKGRSELLTLQELLVLSSSEVTDEDLITVVTGALDHLPIYQLSLCFQERCLPWFGFYFTEVKFLVV